MTRILLKAMYDPLIEKFIAELQTLPGVGMRSAKRMAMQLFADPRSGQRLASSMTEAMSKVNQCSQCRNYTTQNLCVLCADKRRIQTHLCIVTTPQDLYAIEESGAYRGAYFVLHHLLSPLDNIGTNELGIEKLKILLAQERIHEIILALPYTVEGEITASLIINTVEEFSLSITRLSQGMPAGSDIARMDNITLNYALSGRSTV